MQVAAAAQHAAAATQDAPVPIGVMPVGDDIDDEPARVGSDLPAVDDEARDADLSGLAEQLEAVGEADDIVIVDETGQRVIVTLDPAPFIDVTLDPVPYINNIPARTAGFNTVPEDNIPTQDRTFGGIPTQDRTFGGEGVSFSSHCTTTNVFVIDGAAIVEEDVVDLEGGIVLVD